MLAFIQLIYTIMSVVGWKLSTLLIGMYLAIAGFRTVDVESRGWLFGTKKVYEMQHQTIRVPSQSMFGLMGMLGCTQQQTVSQQVIKRSMRSSAAGKAGLVLMLIAAAGFIAGDVVACTVACAVAGAGIIKNRSSVM